MKGPSKYSKYISKRMVVLIVVSVAFIALVNALMQGFESAMQSAILVVRYCQCIEPDCGIGRVTEVYSDAKHSTHIMVIYSELCTPNESDKSTTTTYWLQIVARSEKPISQDTVARLRRAVDKLQSMGINATYEEPITEPPPIIHVYGASTRIRDIVRTVHEEFRSSGELVLIFCRE
jgi:hypothetical protein